MGSLKQRVLQLPREEKVELLEALKQDLQWDDGVFAEEDLSPDDYAELKRREEMLERGEMKWVSTEEFNNFLKQRRNAAK